MKEFKNNQPKEEPSEHHEDFEDQAEDSIMGDAMVEEDNNQQLEAQIQDEEQLDDKEEAEARLKEITEKEKRKGVCYLSRIPPYMTPAHIRKLLKDYDVQRIYLIPEDQSIRKHRVRTGGNKRVCYTEGWVEFTDKKIAKMVALSLNCQKMVHKKGSFYSEDLWNIKYLPKFKWENLTAKLAYDMRMRKERLKVELNQEKKVQEFYQMKADQSRIINRVINQKQAKGKAVVDKTSRNFGQSRLIQEQQEDQN